MDRRPLLSVRRLVPLLAGAVYALAVIGCAGRDARAEGDELRVWAFGAEGEALAPLAREFERDNPGIRVRVQQIPWTAAHEKLLTAFVGGALPDVAQLGNTWIPEFAALGALQALDSLVARDSTAIPLGDYFPGVLATNVVDDTLFGVPWYVDTRVMFYRSDLLRAAGVMSPPRTWAEWRDALVRVRARQEPGSFPALLPLNEWAQPVILGLQAGAPLLADHGTRGAFRDPRFRRGFAFYVGLFKDSLAPSLAATQISSVFQEFGAGRAAMYITGPWNVGEFRKRLPPSVEWATAPLPGPDSAGVSLAGGSSIVIMRRSAQQAAHGSSSPFSAIRPVRRASSRRPATCRRAGRRGRCRRWRTTNISPRSARSSAAQCRVPPCRRSS
jgi:multiple sugar transport system substrate-binding protein